MLLGDIITFRRTMSMPINYSDNGSIFVLGARNIGNSNELIIKDQRYVDYSEDEFLIEKGDILLSTVGRGIGNFIKFDYPIKAIASHSIFVFQSEREDIIEILNKNIYRIKDSAIGTRMERLIRRNLMELELKE